MRLVDVVRRTRRGLRRLSALSLLATALLGSGVARAAAPPQAAREATPLAPIAARFAGERLGYRVSFLFFDRAAVGRVSLEPASGGSGEPERYLARASVEAKGFLGWFSGQRHVYSSVLAPCEEGTRWCSLRFVMDLADHQHREVRVTTVDRSRGTVSWVVERDGVVTKTGAEPMLPGRRYDDMLAAFYNFRVGAYGPVEPGRRYEVETLPVEGVRSFTIRVLDGAEAAKARRDYDMDEAGFVIAAKIPPGVFGEEAEVFAWLSPAMLPLGGRIENYVGSGDLSGHLVEAVRPGSAPTGAGPAGG